jgi:hypothetical protein
MPTMTALATTTLGSATNTITFSSIPQTFTDLVIKASLRGSTTTTTFAVQVNGSTITSVMRLYGTGSSAASDSFNEHYINPSDFTVNTFGNTEIYFPNYTDSLLKSFTVTSVSENNATQSYLNFGSNTGASDPITSISLIRTNGNFVQYSTAYLYGISNA